MAKMRPTHLVLSGPADTSGVWIGTSLPRPTLLSQHSPAHSISVSSFPPSATFSFLSHIHVPICLSGASQIVHSNTVTRSEFPLIYKKPKVFVEGIGRDLQVCVDLLTPPDDVVRLTQTQVPLAPIAFLVPKKTTLEAKP